jgi:hypothetical protein
MNTRKRTNIDGISPRRKTTTKKSLKTQVVLEEKKRIIKKRVPQNHHHTATGLKAKNKYSSIWLKVLRIAAPITLGVIASIITLNQLDSAHVRISPHRDLVAVDFTDTLLKNPEANDLDFAVIAITDSADIPIEADTQVALNKYASGTIRIFNEYSTAAQRLAPSTRFESVDGKVFMLSDEEDLVIPGMTDEGPGEVTVNVYASEPGEDYNIDVTDFSIPGFSELGLEEKYRNIYALSVKPFSGGYTGTRPEVSEQLKGDQKIALQERLVKKLNSRLITDKTFGMALMENSTLINLNEISFETNDGGNQGVLSASGTLYALLVSKQRLGTYLAERELAPLDDERVVLDDTSTVTVRYIGDDINYETIDKAQVRISGEALLVWQPHTEHITEELLGLRKENLELMAEKFRSIRAITVSNHPRWRRALPEERELIDLTIINN